MKTKNYLYVILLLIVCTFTYFSIIWYIDYSTNKEILENIRAIAFAGTEKQIVSKVNMLVSQAESEPDKSENWGKLGMTLLIHDYIEPSVPCFEKANSLDPEHFRWPYFCAIALDELNSDDAHIWYEKAKQLDSSYPPLNIKLGNRYLLSGRLKEAKDLLSGSSIFEFQGATCVSGFGKSGYGTE